jgi:hypothetical protein
MKCDTQPTGVFTRRALLMMGGQVAVPGALGARLYQVQVQDGARYSVMFGFGILMSAHVHRDVAFPAARADR